MKTILSSLLRRFRDPGSRLTALVALVLLAGLVLFFVRRYRTLESAGPGGANLFLFLLINVNVVLLTILVFLLARNIIKLVWEGRRKVFGYHLRAKLVAIFVGFTAVPTLLLFFVARGIVDDSVEYWFRLDVQKTVEGAVAVTSDYYHRMGEQARLAAGKVSERLAAGAADLAESAEEARREWALAAVEVFDPAGKLVVRAWDGVSPGEVTPHAGDLVQSARGGRTVDRTRRAERGEFVQGAAPILLGGGKGTVVVSFWLPEDLRGKTEDVAATYRGLTETKLMRSPFKTNYVVYLMLLAFLILFSASWVGFYLARIITVPIGKLAEGAEKVAGGDLAVRVDADAGDEVGILVSSFNRMTERLQEGQRLLASAHADLSLAYQENEQRRLYIETVLRNVGTGVITLDPEGRVATFNRAAERMFGVRAEEVLGKPYGSVLSPEHARLIGDILGEAVRRKSGRLRREIPVVVGGSPLILHINVSMLEDAQGKPMGTVVVAEDMTKLIHAQREAAWSEVARRVAHEIKNPLTPIKLSAERLRRRLEGTLQGERRDLLDDCTSSIVREVEGLRRLVDEFSQFARLPLLSPLVGSVNDMVAEAAALYPEDHPCPRGVRLDLGSGLPPVSFDREQLKRVLVNLLDNARAAVADRGDGEVAVSTRFLAEEGMVEIDVSDTGTGVPDDLAQRIFEPYFSTKEGGTGLGLAIAQRIVEEHGGSIRYERNQPFGSRFILRLPVDIEPRPRDGSEDAGERTTRVAGRSEA